MFTMCIKLVHTAQLGVDSIRYPLVRFLYNWSVAMRKELSQNTSSGLLMHNDALVFNAQALITPHVILLPPTHSQIGSLIFLYVSLCNQ